MAVDKFSFMHENCFMHKTTTPRRAPPLVEQAFSRLRHGVLTGEFPPGAKLRIDELQETFGVSSSPLREALSRLAQEGLVRSDERRGFRVAPISLADIADITRMRLLIDVLALRESIEHGSDAWDADIVVAFHRLERVESKLSDGPVVLDDEWSDLHRGFHLSLLAACPSDRLLAWSASLFDQAERYRRFSARFRKSTRRKSNEHRKIMDAALRRDADTACALLTEHIASTQRNIETVLREQTFE